MKHRLIRTSFFIAIFQILCLHKIMADSIEPALASDDFIVMTNGDTINGNIEKNLFGKYNLIHFQHPNGDKSTYSPEEIAAFGFQNGKTYVSNTLPGLQEVAFVQLLFSGKLNLMGSGSKYYITTAEETFELKKKYEDEKAKLVPRYRRQYINILKVFMAGSCGYELKDRISSVKYKSKKLVDIFERYHECEDLKYQIHI